MILVGDTGGGMGVLSSAQAFTWLAGKDGRNFNGATLKSKLKACISDIEGASGDTNTGGGSTRYTFNGAASYHESNGVGAHGGMSVFYVKRPGNVAKVIATGYHIGAQTYALTWVHHDWTRMRNVNTLTLD